MSCLQSGAYKAMATETFKLRKQLHQSGIELLGKCGVAFEFRFLKGLKRPPSAYLICGSATDAGVTTDLTHKISTGELEQESVVTDVVRDAVANHPERDAIVLEEDDKGKSIAQVLDETKDKAVSLVTAHHGEIAPTIQPTAVARKFSLNMDRWLRAKAKDTHARAELAENSWLKRVLHEQASHLGGAARDGFDFVGEQDIVENYSVPTKFPLPGGYGELPDDACPQELVIRDTKTSKKSPSENTAHESNQLSAYALASQVLDGKLPDALKLDYLIDLKRGVKTMVMETKRNPEDATAYLNRVVNAIVSIRSGVFVPAPNTAWWCSAKWCGYHSICPHVRHQVTTVGKNPLVQITPGETEKEA
jgi:hypothetical protein